MEARRPRGLVGRGGETLEGEMRRAGAVQVQSGAWGLLTHGRLKWPAPCKWQGIPFMPIGNDLGTTI